MSTFLDTKTQIIEPGSLVLVWISRNNIKPLKTIPGEVLQTRFGAFPHDSMIGKNYGSQIASSSNTGFVHLLAPTAELWTMSLPHRTQIVYTPDSSYIIQRLKIRPGSRVIESGTGSGSFTHSLARTVGTSTNGKVFTYEFHQARYEQAKVEFEDHGLSNVHITHRDVCNDGFEITDIDTDTNVNVDADAVFLDLPSPWTAIPHLKKVTNRKKIVNICCFSPCIEQVTKTVEALKKAGFQHIEMVEVMARRWEARKDMVKQVDDAVARLRDIRERRTEGLKRRNDRLEMERQGLKRKLSNEEVKQNLTEETKDTKKAGVNPFGKGESIKEGDPKFEWDNVTKVENEIKTHTSYLTFAVLPPRDF